MSVFFDAFLCNNYSGDHFHQIDHQIDAIRSCPATCPATCTKKATFILVVVGYPGGPRQKLPSPFVLDDFGHHSLSCKHEGMWFRAIISSGMFFLDFCQRACLGPRLEMGCGAGYTNSQSRPADVLVPNWVLGKPAAFDLSITSTLHPSVLLEASMTAGSAALVAKNRKHKYNVMNCEKLGWVCIPLVVETYECWGAAAVAAFSKLAGRLSTRLN